MDHTEYYLEQTSTSMEESTGGSPVWITNTIKQFKFGNFTVNDFKPPTIHETTISSSNYDYLADDSNELTHRNDEMNGLIVHAKEVAKRLQSLVEKSEASYQLTVDGRAPTYEELLDRLQNVLAHQRNLNQATSQMTSTNYVVNMVNLVRNRQLRTLVQKGRQQLKEMQENVIVLESQLDDVNVELEVQKKVADRLRSNLDSTKTLLESSIIEYREEMARHREILNKQKETLSQIMKSKFNQDFFLDSGILAVSLYVCNTESVLCLALVEYPISLLALLLARKGTQRQTFTKQLFKFILVIYAVMESRKILHNYGLHNHVGTVSGYIWSIFRRVSGSSKTDQ